MTKISGDKPKQDFNTIGQNGLKALQLATEHGVVVVDRLPAGSVAALGTDIASLGVLVPGAVQARKEKVTATQGQNTKLEAGANLLSAVRDSVKGAVATAEQRKAYGVGLRINAKVVKHVVAGLQQAVDRARELPDEALGFGITAADVEAMARGAQELATADRAQETQIAAAPLSTRARNLAARRILATVTRIAAAGALQFANDPVERARYDQLVARPQAKKPPKSE